MELQELLRIPSVDPDYGFALAPHGDYVAFSWNLSGQWEIYVAALDRSAPPRRLTSGQGAKFAPRWSPDGTRLAYAVDVNGGEQFDLYAHDLRSGQPTNLTPGTPDSIQPCFAWSPDGSRLAFISDRSGRFEPYIMAAARGAPGQRVVELPFPAWEVRWSPDGHWLAIVVEALGQDYATAIVAVDGSALRWVSLNGVRISAKDAAWAPDSKRVAFSSNVRGWFDIGVYDLRQDSISWATVGQRDRDRPAWSPGGGRIACTARHGPVTALATLELDEKRETTYQVKSGVHYWPLFSPGGDQLVFAFDNPERPTDLWQMLLSGPGCPENVPTFHQLTQSLPSHLSKTRFGMPTQVTYPSLDGQTVPALLYRTEAIRGDSPCSLDFRQPAVVYVHGGPNWLAQVTWDPLIQHMIARGWVVIAPNYRGSTGHGRVWQLANRFDLGGGDSQDVVAAADYLVRKGLADPDRIAVTGRSYGGYLTMTCLTQFPERWAAGSAVVPFLNWFTAHANSRSDLQHWDVENFGHPERDRDRFRERSPFFFLDRIVAPVQLICGAHDPRCPASESTQAHEALVELGKACDLALYPDEGHSFLKIENVVDHKERLVSFLAAALDSTDG